MTSRKTDQAAGLLESGLRGFQQGQLEQARHYCEKALAIAPGNPDALHLLGVIALRNGEPATAVKRLEQAVAIRSDHPDYYASLAYGYVGTHRLPEALAAFQRAARLKPNDPDLEIGIGNCLAMLGRPADAEGVFRRLVERHPRHALGWFNLANAVNEQERHEEARILYGRVTLLAPQSAEAYNNLGVVSRKLGRLDEAESAFRACLALKADFLPAYASLAIVLNDLRRPREAETLCRESLSRDPNQQIALSMLGKALALQNHWHEAIAAHEKAVALGPRSAEAHGYLGDALARTGRLDEALAAFDRAILLDPGASYPRYAKSIALLAHGRIHEGAAEYRHRDSRKLIQEHHPGIAFSETLPDDLSGRRVLLFGEQGIGDELFFLRYAPAVKSRGAHIHVRANARIAGILGRCGALGEVGTQADPLPKADLVLLVGDLPLATMRSPSTGFPPPLPLTPHETSVERISASLKALGPPPYIGLTWRAGTESHAQRGPVWLLFKEIALQELAAAVRDVRGTLLSLQRNPRAGETQQLAALVGRPVHDLSALNDELEDMLAALAVIDDYVGVSNTNMHLRAGAGGTARVLVPWPAEWRWMAAGDESPWFPGFRTYRQGIGGEWGEATERLRRDLRGASYRGASPIHSGKLSAD